MISCIGYLAKPEHYNFWFKRYGFMNFIICELAWTGSNTVKFAALPALSISMGFVPVTVRIASCRMKAFQLKTVTL